MANGAIVGIAHIGAVVSGFGGALWMDVALYLPFYLNAGAYVIAAGFALMLEKDTSGVPLADEEEPVTARDHSQERLGKTD